MLPNVNFEFEVPSEHANFTKNQTVALNTGVSNVVLNTVTASSRTSNSLVNFKPQISKGSVINDDMVFSFKVQFLGTRAGTTSTSSTFSSPEQWGFASGGLLNLIERATVIDNGKQYDIQVRDYVELQSTYIPCENGTIGADMLHGPVYNYSYGSFSSPELTTGEKYLGRASGLVQNSNADGTVLTDYTPDSTVAPQYFSIIANFELKLPFSLFNNPVLGTETLDISMQFSNTPEDIFDLLTPTTAHDQITTLSFKFLEDPKMIFMTSNMHSYIYDHIKGPKTYNVVEPRRHTSVKDALPVLSNAERTARVEALVLDVVPKKIWLCAKRVTHKRDGIDTISNVARKIKHTYGVIQRINNVRLGNFDLVLSGMTPYNTYLIAKKNGYQHSYAMWKQVGGPICLDLTEGDIGIPSDLFVGAQHTMNFQAEFVYKNAGFAAESFIIECWAEYDRYLTLDSSTHVEITSVNTGSNDGELRKDLLQLMDSSQVVGGSFFGNLWSGIKKYTPKVLSALPQILSTYKSIRGNKANKAQGENFAPTTTGSKNGKGINQDIQNKRVK